MSRRTFIRGAGLVAAGALAGTGGTLTWDSVRQRGDPAVSATGTETPIPQTGKAQGRATLTWAVETRKKLIALTFDDGPVPNDTPHVLDALEAANVRATFFLVGARLEANIRLVEGRLTQHEVGNHTWSHKDLSLAESYDAAFTEIQKGHQAISTILGRVPTLFRPPWGRVGDYAMRAADRFDYAVILWSQGVTESDFQAKPDSVVPWVVGNVTPGTIFLAHDAVADGVKPAFLPRIGTIAAMLRDKGYEFVTVSELMAQREPGLGLGGT